MQIQQQFQPSPQQQPVAHYINNNVPPHIPTVITEPRKIQFTRYSNAPPLPPANHLPPRPIYTPADQVRPQSYNPPVSLYPSHQVVNMETIPKEVHKYRPF